MIGGGGVVVSSASESSDSVILSTVIATSSSNSASESGGYNFYGYNSTTSLGSGSGFAASTTSSKTGIEDGFYDRIAECDARLGWGWVGEEREIGVASLWSGGVVWDCWFWGFCVRIRCG